MSLTEVNDGEHIDEVIAAVMTAHSHGEHFLDLVAEAVGKNPPWPFSTIPSTFCQQRASLLIDSKDTPTGRAALHVRSKHVFLVHPQENSVIDLPAVALTVDRARTFTPEFDVDARTIPFLTVNCRHLMVSI